MNSLKAKDLTHSKRLGKHLILIVVIKALVLYGLWYSFIRPNKVKVNTIDIEQIYTSQSVQPSIKQNAP